MSIGDRDPESYECFCIAPPVEAATEVVYTRPLPGSNRRNWVYAEMALLGADAAPRPNSSET